MFPFDEGRFEEFEGILNILFALFTFEVSLALSESRPLHSIGYYWDLRVSADSLRYLFALVVASVPFPFAGERNGNNDIYSVKEPRPRTIPRISPKASLRSSLHINLQLSLELLSGGLGFTVHPRRVLESQWRGLHFAFWCHCAFLGYHLAEDLS